MNTQTTAPTPTDVADLIEPRVSPEAAGERGIEVNARSAATRTYPMGRQGLGKFLSVRRVTTATVKNVYGSTQGKAMRTDHSSVVTKGIESVTGRKLVRSRKVMRARAKLVREALTGMTSGPEISLSERIANICTHPKLRFAKRLGKRLQALLAISEEEQPDQAPPALASVKSLVAFLAAHPELAYPSVVLTQEGNVRVQWGGGPNKHFAVEFLGDGDVRFVIFAPDPRHPYKTIRVSGSATVDSVMRLAEPYDVRSWTDELFVGADAQ